MAVPRYRYPREHETPVLFEGRYNRVNSVLTDSVESTSYMIIRVAGLEYAIETGSNNNLIGRKLSFNDGEYSLEEKSSMEFVLYQGSYYPSLSIQGKRYLIDQDSQLAYLITNHDYPIKIDNNEFIVVCFYDGKFYEVKTVFNKYCREIAWISLQSFDIDRGICVEELRTLRRLAPGRYEVDESVPIESREVSLEV